MRFKELLYLVCTDTSNITWAVSFERSRKRSFHIHSILEYWKNSLYWLSHFKESMLPYCHKFLHICTHCWEYKYILFHCFFLKFLSYISCICYYHSYDISPNIFQSYSIISISRSKSKSQYPHPFITDNMKLESVKPSSTAFPCSCFPFCYFVRKYSLVFTYF